MKTFTFALAASAAIEATIEENFVTRIKITYKIHSRK